jgi:hypothetical protein
VARGAWRVARGAAWRAGAACCRARARAHACGPVARTAAATGPASPRSRTRCRLAAAQTASPGRRCARLRAARVRVRRVISCARIGVSCSQAGRHGGGDGGVFSRAARACGARCARIAPGRDASTACGVRAAPCGAGARGATSRQERWRRPCDVDSHARVACRRRARAHAPAGLYRTALRPTLVPDSRPSGGAPSASGAAASAMFAAASLRHVVPSSRLLPRRSTIPALCAQPGGVPRTVTLCARRRAGAARCGGRAHGTGSAWALQLSPECAFLTAGATVFFSCAHASVFFTSRGCVAMRGRTRNERRAPGAAARA